MFPAKRATGKVDLTDDFGGDLWQGAVSVGTPLDVFSGKDPSCPANFERSPQKSVDFDTGSSDFFLPGPDCTENCEGHKVFNPEESRTSIDQHRTFTIEFADGSVVAGEVFEDTVSLGGLNATSQAVGVATEYSEGFAIAEFPPDGLLGMAFESIAQTQSSPVFQTLVEQGQTTIPVFGFTLLENGGELFLGGTDTTAFTGPLTFTPLIVTNPPAFWEITVQSVSVGGVHVVTAVQDAIVDTGTTLLIVDPESATKIYARIPNSRNADDEIGEGFFIFPCNEDVPPITFTIATKQFTLSQETFNFGPVEAGSNDCVGGIMGDNEGR